LRDALNEKPQIVNVSSLLVSRVLSSTVLKLPSVGSRHRCSHADEPGVRSPYCSAGEGRDTRDKSALMRDGNRLFGFCRVVFFLGPGGFTRGRLTRRSVLITRCGSCLLGWSRLLRSRRCGWRRRWRFLLFFFFSACSKHKTENH